MKFYVVIPVHNEEAYLMGTVQSLLQQTHPPAKIVLVDDRSTDGSWSIIRGLSEKYESISGVQTGADQLHMPGAKVVQAFYKGFERLDDAYDVICKYDADLIFPPDYLQQLAEAFVREKGLGICGGICLVDRNGNWVPEVVADSDHVRGALKAYRKACFHDIGGIKRAMGWDSLDELLAAFHKWNVRVLDALEVKHLRVTGATYSSKTRYLKGEALFKMGYGFPLSFIASVKLSAAEGKPLRFFDHMVGFLRSWMRGEPKVVTSDEATFIRKLRWQRIRQKLSA